MYRVLQLAVFVSAITASSLILDGGSGVLWGSMQVAAPPSFETASVKRTAPGSDLTWGWCRGTDSSDREGPWIGGRILPGMQVPARPALGRCAITGATLKAVVRAAFNLAPTIEVTGGPGWADSDRFDIESKAEDPSKATGGKLQQMLQQLLVDRFKLKLHRETKEVSGVLLVVAGSGAKLKEVPTDANATPVGGRPGDMTFRGAPLGVLAEILSSFLGQPVEDRTGLTGRYSFTLEWTIGDTEQIPPQFDRTPDPARPSLATALQEQLGLRLQSAKLPVPVVVIDSAERPLPN
jgi:uncharacterized protein (TIGR03435 family)